MSILSVKSNLEQNYMNISSAKRINSAADDAAGLSIAEGLRSQATGYRVGTNNAKDGQNLVNIAEGGLGSINDYLQRIRELAVQASNGVYTADDKQMMQDEIDQLKEGIVDVAKNTEYNTIKLLDGSKADIKLATNPSGTGMSIHTVNTTLESLGIADFDVTGDFKISDIDNAISKVSASRSSLGAKSNALEHTVNANNIAKVNMISSQSVIEDADIAEEITSLRTNQVLEQYRYFAQAQRQEQRSSLLSLFNMM